MIFDILGWIGMVLVLIAYGLLSANKISNGKLYQGLNVLAAVFMAIGLLPKNAWFSFANKNNEKRKGNIKIIWQLKIVN